MVIGDTLSVNGIFQILCVIDRIKSWGEDVYWPWLKDNVLLPLSDTATGAAPEETLTS